MPHANSVTVCFFVRAGAVYETRKAAGLSHFIEHMLFKGTQKRTAAQQAAEIDGVGGQINAYTAKENTCYYVRLLPEHLELAFDILSDMLLRPLLPPEEIEREKGVVLEEISMVEDTPDDVAHEALTEAFFQGHPLARPILGTPKSVQGITQQDILTYMQKHYGARDTVVAVAGRFEDTHLNELFHKYLQEWPHSPSQKRIDTHTPLAPEGRIHKKKTIEQAHICLGYPGITMGSEDTYALMTLNNILGGGMSSRLFQKIREERGLAYSVYSYPGFFKKGGMYTLYAGTNPEQLAEVESIMRQQATEMAQGNFTDEEYQRACRQMRASYMLTQDSTQTRAQGLGRSYLLLGKPMDCDEVYAKMEAVTPEKVRGTAAALLSKEPYVSVVSGA